MSTLPAGSIRLDGVGKRFTKYEDTPTLAYGLLHLWKRTRRGKLWAVRDVELDIEPGDAVGVIGKNGSGKSTLLQMLCGVTSPTEGTVHIGGRIAPLISVGVGFHPELTGRENVFVNGSILGLKKSEIQRRFDEIVEFSGIEAFIDTPVKFYSSGMFVRLGFSVAAHIDPDVLLIDEVLAVGDLAFQWKCFKHLTTLREQGTTVVLVSHNMAAVERHCQRAIVMRDGQKVVDGNTDDAVAAYNQIMLEDAERTNQSTERYAGVMEPDSVRVLSTALKDSRGRASEKFTAHDEMRLEVEIEALKAVQNPYLAVSIVTPEGLYLFRENNLFRPFDSLAPGKRTVLRAAIPLALARGSYTLEFSIHRANELAADATELADDVASLTSPQRLTLYVEGRPNARGLVDLPTTFDSTTPRRRRSS
ncbi:MAG: ABC transporter ATP-binding protein [Mycobacteriales bacterium]